jgi:hypothetical protein
MITAKGSMYALFDICGNTTVGLKSVFMFGRKLVVVVVVVLFSWYCCCCGTAYADIFKVEIPFRLYDVDITRIAATNVNDDNNISILFIS